MLFSFFFFTNAQLMNEYKINDLFSVRQGKQMLNKNKQITNSQNDKGFLNSNVIKVLTMSSINFDNKTIEPDFFLDYVTNKANDEDNFLSADNYIINRVGKIKSVSLLDFVDFDFTETNVLASNHFIVLTPRKIVLENLPLFHTLVDVALKDLMDKKITTKVQSVSVKEIQNITISIPPEGFDTLTRMFMEIYQPYLNSLKNLKFHKNLLEGFKNELNKKQ